MLAIGAAVMVTVAVATTAAQAPEAARVYLTVYVPAVLKLGFIDPETDEIIKPEGSELYVPPDVPIRVTVRDVVMVLHHGEPV